MLTLHQPCPVHTNSNCNHSICITKHFEGYILPGEFGERLDMWSAVLITVTVECFPELSNDDARADMDVEAQEGPSLPMTTSEAQK